MLFITTSSILLFSVSDKMFVTLRMREILYLITHTININYLL